MTSLKDHRSRSRTGKRGRLFAVAIGAGAVVLLAAIFALIVVLQPPKTDPGSVSASGYAVGSPGPGATAPAFSLPSTSGGAVALSQYRGRTVLLYFHEGLGCQPCWDQIRDLDAAQDQLKAAGIDQLLTITSGPKDLIAQKMADDNLTGIALADTTMDVSRNYAANQYGMMGDSRDGHTFILVGPDGRIQWRADYGGAPNYTMYVPVAKILSDLKAGRSK